MEGFGSALRAQRTAAGMRQADLVDALDNVIARSTLANVEVGRENPSPRLWEAIRTHLPHWVPALEPSYTPRTTPPPDGSHPGPYDLLHATDAYTFRDHRSPEEIIQVRRVRSRAQGATGYVLHLAHASESFDVDAEPLWGGWVERHERTPTAHGRQHALHVRFDRPLERGEEVDFAVRSWVVRDVPDDSLGMSFTVPTASATLAATFAGRRPRRLWRVESDDHDDLLRGEPAPDDRPLALSVGGALTVRVRRPAPGRLYGMAWTW